MNGITSTLRPRTDQDVLPQGQGDTREEPDFLDTFKASAAVAMDDQMGAADRQRQSAYMGLYSELVRRGRPASRYMTPGMSGEPVFQPEYIWADAVAEGLVDVSREQFDKTWQEQARQAYDQNADTANRGGTAPWLLGGMAGAMTDPLNQFTMFLGGGAASTASEIVKMGLREAAIGAATELVQTPVVAGERAAQGREQEGLQETASRIAIAGAASGLLPVTVEGAGKVLPALDAAGYRAMAPVRQKVDRFAADRDVARAFSDAVPEYLRTPEQQAALDVLGRQAEIEDASPYARTYDGDDRHQQRLFDAMEQVANPPARTAAPATANFDEVKRQIRGPESAGDDMATNRMGSSASGRYQFIESTFKALYRKAYRVDEAAAQQAWNTRRFDVGVQEALMDRLLAENAAALRQSGVTVDNGNLYLAHVLGAPNAVRLIRARPDMPVARLLSERVVAQNPTYFGGGRTVGEAIATIRGKVGGGADPGAAVRAPGGESDDALFAALDAERADIEAARARSDAEAAGLARSAGDEWDELADPYPMPELRRDLFPDETSWRVAQSAADAEELGIAPAVTRQSVWEDARDRLMADKAGEVRGALYHPEVGPIDVKWGDDKGGLAHIVADHAEVLDRLPEIIEAMDVDQARSGNNRMRLESPDHKAVVSLNWHGEDQRWLITAFEKRENAPPNQTSRRGSDRAPDGGSTGTGADSAIPERHPSGNLTPGDLLARYWASSSEPAPVWVARDAAGDVVGWSRHGPELEARVGGDGVTVRQEADPSTEAVRDADMADPALARFSEPEGQAIAAEADGLTHDIRAAIDRGELEGLDFATGRDGAAESPALMMARLDADEAAIAALRECLK